LTVFKTPSCACFDGWIAHMREAGATAATLAELEQEAAAA